MARFSGSDISNYGNSSSSYFSLKNDKDIAQVRFLYDTVEDVVGYSVHEIEVNGNKRYVNCLRAYNEPIDNCPLCSKGSKIIAKLYIPLLVYNLNGKPEVQLWERGKNWWSKLSSIGSRYNPICGTVFEIERNGKAGDTQTTYETYPIEQNDGTTLAQIKEEFEITDPSGTIILDKDYDEIIHYLETGNFPETETSQSQETFRPRGQQTGGYAPRQHRGGVATIEEPSQNSRTRPRGNYNGRGSGEVF